MKFLVSQFSYLLADKEARLNLKALRTYLFFMLGIVLVLFVVFMVLTLVDYMIRP